MEGGTRNAPAVGVVDLSNLYISLDVLQRWRQRLQQKTLNDNKEIAKFLMASSVLVREAENHDLLMQELQQLLSDVSRTLTLISCDHSNVSGQIFFRGIEVEVLKPDDELVTVEGWKKANGKIAAKAIVRDDSPEQKIKADDVFYHYVETKYSAAQNKFFRCYALTDWLQRVTNVSMTTTAISGHGLTALVAATGSSLQVLNVSGCPALDDKGIHSLVTLCTALRELNVSNCPRLTSHGLMYISEFSEKQIQNLTLVDVANDHVPQQVPRALFYALDLRGFSGTIKYIGLRGLQSHQAPKRLPDAKPLLLDWCAQNSMSILDLCGMDITAQVLSSAFDDRTKWRLDLTDHMINDTLLAKYLSIWGGRLSYLSLDGTYITEKGLKELKACPQLKALRLCGCPNVINKNEANINLAPCIAAMPDLESVAVSSTRISGRMLSEHPSLKLTSLEAARTPFSVHAISWLVQFCPNTLKSLSLAGCDFINIMCVKYIVHLPQLETLDLSYIMDLEIISVATELLDKNSELNNLRKLKVAGVAGATPKYCEILAEALRARFSQEVVDVDGEESAFLYPQERIQADASPYTRIPPPELHRAQTAPILEQKSTYTFWQANDVLPSSDTSADTMPPFSRATSGPDGQHPAQMSRLSYPPPALLGASLSSASSSYPPQSFPLSPTSVPPRYLADQAQLGGMYTTWNSNAFVDESFPWGAEEDPLSKVRQMSEHESYVGWVERRNSVHGGERKRGDDGRGRNEDESHRGDRSRRRGGDDDGSRRRGEDTSRRRGGGGDDDGSRRRGRGGEDEGSRRRLGEDEGSRRRGGEDEGSRRRRGGEDEGSRRRGGEDEGSRRRRDEDEESRRRGDDGSRHRAAAVDDDDSYHGGHRSRGSREPPLSPQQYQTPQHLGSPDSKRGSVSTMLLGALNTSHLSPSEPKRGSLTPVSPDKRGSLNTMFVSSPHGSLSPHATEPKRGSFSSMVVHGSPLAMQYRDSSQQSLVASLKSFQISQISPPSSPEPHPGREYALPSTAVLGPHTTVHTKPPLSPNRQEKPTPLGEFKGAVSPSRFGGNRKERESA